MNQEPSTSSDFPEPNLDSIAQTILGSQAFSGQIPQIDDGSISSGSLAFSEQGKNVVRDEHNTVAPSLENLAQENQHIGMSEQIPSIDTPLIPTELGSIDESILTDNNVPVTSPAIPSTDSEPATFGVIPTDMESIIEKMDMSNVTPPMSLEEITDEEEHPIMSAMLSDSEDQSGGIISRNPSDNEKLTDDFHDSNLIDSPMSFGIKPSEMDSVIESILNDGFKLPTSLDDLQNEDEHPLISAMYKNIMHSSTNAPQQSPAGTPSEIPESSSEINSVDRSEVHLERMGIQSTQFLPDNEFDYKQLSQLSQLEFENLDEEGATQHFGSDLFVKVPNITYGIDDSAYNLNPEVDEIVNLPDAIYDVHAYRKDFPVLQRRVHGKQLVWLDNGATTQKPQQVIDAVSHYYEKYNSNIHRAAHTLAAEATDAYEEAREKVRRFINAEDKKQCIFLRGTTEGINLIAYSYGRMVVEEDDEVIVTELEHHANIVPWQLLCQEKNAHLRVARVDDNGELMMNELDILLSRKPKILAVTMTSNAIGTVTPIKEIINMAHKYDVRVVVDAAQSIQHMPVDVQDLDADFFVFSGHKIFAPMGIGVVYGKEDLLRKMLPFQSGGAMIKDVTFEKSVFKDIPEKFEAGSPNVSGPIGLGVALDYLSNVGMENIHQYELNLTKYALEKLRTIPGLKIIGNAKDRISVLSFVIEDVPVEKIGKVLEEEGIAVRVGHHCAQPILRRFGYEMVVRPSLAFYNTKDEVDFLVKVLNDFVKKKLRSNK